ncbi:MULTISPECIES: extracellular solute-binding protein [Paenibacillus]|uniref:ABC transporter substrate-binding protein n=1 Tax=Paenibacillus lautus TaxID=1401 RepID=A0A1R1AZN0_PAELA|nr:extracellular solute-binding protein [Paenibacillus lautus]OME91546.1 ABC transporter substrate-binding protein [Paenibacillus lautus]
MRKTKKSLLLMVSLIFVLVTALAGCGGKSAEPAPAAPPAANGDSGEKTDPPAEGSDEGKWVLGEKPLQFSAYAHYEGTDFPKWESVPLGKYLSEEKQVKIDVIAANGAHKQKLSAMIASDDLPDLIWTDRDEPMILSLQKEGKLVAFDPWLDKYPNLKTWMGDLDLLRADDGKIYRFPNWYSSNPYGTAGYVVNKKIYDELGQPPLETTDDLYNYLKMVKDKYGDTIVPFEPHRAQDRQGLGVLYTAFGEQLSYSNLKANLLAVPKDGKLTPLLTDPTFREAQKYIAKLYREKLISQDAFSQTEDMVKEKVMTGRVAVFAGSSPTDIAAKAQIELTKDDPNGGYFMIWPIHKPGLDKNKITAGTYTSFGWNAAHITTAAEDPEAIFAFLDWMTGPEGMNVQFFGPEGKNWKGFDENGQPNFTENYDREEVTKISAENSPWQLVGNTSYIDPAKWKYMSTLPAEEQQWEVRYQQTVTWPTQLNVTEFVGLDAPPNSDEDIIAKSVDELFLEIYANSVMAKSDEEVDQILDQGNKSLMDLGYQQLLDYRTAKWQANLEKQNK